MLAPSQDEISDRTLSRSPRISDNMVLGNALQTRKTDEPGPLVDRVTIIGELFDATGRISTYAILCVCASS